MECLGIYKFNNLASNNKAIIVPLGGINLKNLNRLKDVRSETLAIFSEIKKSRLRFLAGFSKLILKLIKIQF